MLIQQLSNNYSVCAQPTPTDLASLSSMGFVTLICNRVEGEEPGMPSLSVMRQAAEQAGLSFHCIPMSGPFCSEDQYQSLQQIMAASNGPVLAYCRSGKRSALLWQSMSNLSNQQKRA